MKRHQNPQSRRRGSIAPFVAVLLIPMLGMVAFAVDMGWITHTQNELQSAADAAALAGAAQLESNYANYYMIPLNGESAAAQAAAQLVLLNAAKTNATTYAQNYASYNEAGDVTSLTLLSSDIQFGYTDSSGNYTALPTYTGFPNTVKVTMRRDSTANGPLGLFFAQVLGFNSINLTATAAATIYAGNVNSIQTANSSTMQILPMTYDINWWNNFVATGQNPDNITTLDANGVPILKVYPSIKDTGNFGELSLDQGNDGASTISGWISNGVSNTDLQREVNAGLLPLSADTSTVPDWKGNPGLKTSTIHTANDYVGKSFLLPLFTPYDSDPTNYQAGTGGGSHYYYRIVQFVGVTIESSPDGGIYVQPAPLVNPNFVLTGIAPAAPPTGSQPVIPTVFAGAKLTQ